MHCLINYTFCSSPAWLEKQLSQSLMVPEAKKAAAAAAVYGGHTVDKVGFHLETRFRATGHAQNKLAIKANV